MTRDPNTRIREFEELRHLGAVGHVADEVVRSLSSLKDGKTEHRADASIAEAQSLFQRMAEQLSSPYRVEAGLKLHDALRLFGSPVHVQSSTNDIGEDERNGFALFFRRVISDLEDVRKGTSEPDQVERLIDQFDALGEATLIHANESVEQDSLDIWALT